MWSDRDAFYPGEGGGLSAMWVGALGLSSHQTGSLAKAEV